MSDDCRVDEDEQRFGDQRAERGDGEREDLPIISTLCSFVVHLLVLAAGFV
jgi:hypothetical protein